MNNKKDFFEDNNYKYISKFIEEKIHLLKQNSDYDQKYRRLFNLIDELNKELPINYKEKFNEIINLTYSVEEYYLVLAYSLGVKYGENLKNL